MKDETKIALSIAYLYTTIIIIFSVIAYLLEYVFMGADNIDKHYTINITLIFDIFALIMIVLFTLNKKRGQNLSTAFRNSTSRKTVGALILTGCIIGMSLYVPALINSISQIINKTNDGTLYPNIICFVLNLCPIVIAIYFLNFKEKTSDTRENNVLIGVPFFYIFITACFSLLSRFTQPIVSSNTLKLHFFIWLFCTLFILMVLFLFMRKRNQSIISTFQNITIRKTVGLLVVISGLINITDVLNDILGSVWLLDFLGGMDRSAQLGFVLDIVRIIIFACQIVLGFFILKIKKNNISTENQD